MKETTPRLLLQIEPFVELGSRLAKFGHIRAQQSFLRRLSSRADAGTVRSDRLPCAVMSPA